VTGIVLRDAAVGHGLAAALPPVSFDARAGAVTVVATEGGQRPTVLSLVASGRMAVDAGSVEAPRRRIALVDTPTVAEHPDDVRVAAVVREELALAGRRGTRRELDRLGLAAWSARPFGALPAADRIRLLADLALSRPGVDALVVTSPERHGGDPAAWFRVLRRIAAHGTTVLVVTDHATRDALPDIPAPAPDAVPLFDSASEGPSS
jgi:ABC-2 type transport system ATP-binding protein